MYIKKPIDIPEYVKGWHIEVIIRNWNEVAYEQPSSEYVIVLPMVKYNKN